jgi:hypothetical protein
MGMSGGIRYRIAVQYSSGGPMALRVKKGVNIRTGLPDSAIGRIRFSSMRS